MCETFIDNNVADNEISIDGYSIVKKNRNRHGGGVLLYVKDGIDYSEITELASEQVESVWRKLMYKKETLMLGVVHRPPSSNNDYFNCVLNQIDHAHSLNENIILMGDLNYNYTFDESLSGNPLHQIEVLYNMRQLITSPTRVTLTTSTLIDVLFTNAHNSHVMTGVYDTDLSDHCLIYTVFSKSFVRKERAHKEIKFRNYRNFSPEEFRKELLENDSITNTDWPEHMLSEKWDKFKNVFLTVSNKCAPFETRRLKNRNNPWIDSNIVRLIYKRDYLKRKAVKYKSDELWESYKQIRNTH